MGSMIGGAMQESMQKQQAAMQESQKIMLERQIQMQNMMREKAMSVQLASAKDMLAWWSAAYVTIFIGAIAGFRRSKNPAVMAPLVPLTFIVGYQMDLVYGNKLNRIQAEADRILVKDYHMLAIPQGLPTIEQLDTRRLHQQDSTSQP